MAVKSFDGHLLPVYQQILAPHRYNAEPDAIDQIIHRRAVSLQHGSQLIQMRIPHAPGRYATASHMQLRLRLFPGLKSRYRRLRAAARHTDFDHGSFAAPDRLLPSRSLRLSIRRFRFAPA